MNRAPGQLANATTKVIALAERAQEVIEITELEPKRRDVHRQAHQSRRQHHAIPAA